MRHFAWPRTWSAGALMCVLFLGACDSPTPVQNLEPEQPALQQADAMLDLAMRMSFERIPNSEYDKELDPLLRQIDNLSEFDLRLFLDFRQAINALDQEDNFLADTEEESVFEGDQEPAFPSDYEVAAAGQWNLVKAASTGSTTLKLSKTDQQSVDDLAAVFADVRTGSADRHFSSDYPAIREATIKHVAGRGVSLFATGPDVDQAFADEMRPLMENSLHLGKQGCNAYRLDPINNVEIRGGNGFTRGGWTGKFNVNDQGDCDILVRYNVNVATKVGQDTREGACVLDKFGGAGAWLTAGAGNQANKTYALYGARRVEWWWPAGCNTTKFKVRDGTMAKR